MGIPFNSDSFRKIIVFIGKKGVEIFIKYEILKDMNNQNFSPEDESNLRENLKRCTPETIEAAVEFRKTGDTSKVGIIVIGIISRFVEPNKRELLVDPSDNMVLATELGLDSLSMVEIVLAVEDAIGTSINNDEIQKLRTLGDVKNFINSKVS